MLEESPNARAGLSAALCIQLTGVADIETRPRPRTAGLPASIAAADGPVRSEHALLVVWARGRSRCRTARRKRCCTPWAGEGRAQLEVVRVPGGRGRRWIARWRSSCARWSTRCANSTAGSRSPRRHEQPSAGAGEHCRREATPEPRRRMERRARRRGGRRPARAQRFGQWGTRRRARGRRGLSERYRLAATFQSAEPGARFRARRLARALLAQLDAGPRAWHAALRVGDLWLGARSGARPRLRRRDGYAAPAARRSADYASCPGCSASMRRSSWAPASAPASVATCRLRLRRQRFAIDGEEVADLGRVRPFARLLLTWTPALASEKRLSRPGREHVSWRRGRLRYESSFGWLVLRRCASLAIAGASGGSAPH